MPYLPPPDTTLPHINHMLVSTGKFMGITITKTATATATTLHLHLGDVVLSLAAQSTYYTSPSAEKERDGQRQSDKYLLPRSGLRGGPDLHRHCLEVSSNQGHSSRQVRRQDSGSPQSDFMTLNIVRSPQHTVVWHVSISFSKFIPPRRCSGPLKSSYKLFSSDCEGLSQISTILKPFLCF